MKKLLLTVCFGALVATPALAQQAMAPLPSPMADAATPNGKVVLEFFHLLTEGKPEEAFDKCWDLDAATKAKLIAATRKVYSEHKVRDQAVAVTSRGDWVILDVIESIDGKAPVLTKRAQLMKNGKIIKHEVAGSMPVAEIAAAATKVAAE